MRLCVYSICVCVHHYANLSMCACMCVSSNASVYVREVGIVKGFGGELIKLDM